MDGPKITLEETAYRLAFEGRQKISERDRKFNEIIQGDDSLSYVTQQILNISAQKLIQEELDSDQPVTDKKALEEKYFDHLDREILGFINKHIAEILEVKIDEYWQIVTGIEIKEKKAWKELCKLARMKDRKERNFKDRISGKFKLNNTAKLMLTALYGKEYQVNPEEKQPEYTEYSFSENILPGISSLAPEEISKLLSEEAIAKFKARVLGVDSISAQSTVNEVIEKAIKGQIYDDAYEALKGSSESLLSKARDLRRGMSRDTDSREIEKYETKKENEEIQKNKSELRKIESEIEILEDNKKQLERELQKLYKEHEDWEIKMTAPLQEFDSEGSKEYIKDVILVDYNERIQRKEREIATKERQIAPLSARAMEYRSRLKILEDKEGEEPEKPKEKHQDLKENLIRELEEIENAAMEIENKLQKLEKQQVKLSALCGLYGLSSEQEEQSKSWLEKAIKADIRNTQDSVAELERQYLTKDERELSAIKRLEKQVTNILTLAKQKTPQELSANLGVLDEQIRQLLDSIKIAYNIDTQKFILGLDSEEHQTAIQSLLKTRNMAGVPLMNIEHNALNAVKLAIFCGTDALKENGLLPKPSWIEIIKNFLINLAIKFEFKSRPELAHSVSLGEVSYLDSEILSEMLGLKQTHVEHPDKEQQNDPAEEATPIPETQKMHSDSETPPEKSWAGRIGSSKEMRNTNKSDLPSH
ncbi:hypothetical protein RLOatenuis_6590 [Rickettsiales bacterium]|nr:hypothetical protein RLOatenuis_6590 [Rickettsiales bacterium]